MLCEYIRSLVKNNVIHRFMYAICALSIRSHPKKGGKRRKIFYLKIKQHTYNQSFSQKRSRAVNKFAPFRRHILLYTIYNRLETNTIVAMVCHTPILPTKKRGKREEKTTFLAALLLKILP